MHNNREEEEEEKDFSASFRVDSPTTIPAAADGSFDHDHSSSSNDEDEEEEFDFSFLSCRDPSSSDAAAAAGVADDIFANGQIRAVYPIFDRKLLLDLDHHHSSSSSSSPAADVDTKHVRLSLRKLFLDERSSTSFSSSSSSSSSASSEKDDELEGVPEGTYCVWTPKASADQQRIRNIKSGSTGSSKPKLKVKKKIRDLVIGRSQSFGKEDKFMFIPNTNKGKITAAGAGDGNGNGNGNGGGGNRKTFLPYKQNLVGFFSGVNAISRTHHPF